MSVSALARDTRLEMSDWGDELSGLHLNLFATQLPAAYQGGMTGKNPKAFSTLRKHEAHARIRRGCFASALALARDTIAADIYSFDEAIEEGTQDDGVWCSLAPYLPPAFSERDDRDFHRRMLALIMSLQDRMRSGSFTTPCCSAEELLLSTVLSEYGVRLEVAELEPGWISLEDHWFQDEDYLLLYTSKIAGSARVVQGLADELDTANLDFDSWFEPFDDACKVPGPASERTVRQINTGQPWPADLVPSAAARSRRAARRGRLARRR